MTTKRYSISTYLFLCFFWPYFYIIILDSLLLILWESECWAPAKPGNLDFDLAHFRGEITTPQMKKYVATAVGVRPFSPYFLSYFQFLSSPSSNT